VIRTLQRKLYRKAKESKPPRRGRLRPELFSVCLTVKPVGEPDAGDRHVRFDERGWETERCRMAQATAPILDSTECDLRAALTNVRSWELNGLNADVAFWAVTLSGILAVWTPRQMHGARRSLRASFDHSMLARR